MKLREPNHNGQYWPAAKYTDDELIHILETMDTLNQYDHEALCEAADRIKELLHETNVIR